MAKDALGKAADRLLALIPPGKEPVAEALAEMSDWTFTQRKFLWRIIKKYEFSLNLIGVKIPAEPMPPVVLPSEPHFVDFINGKFILRLGESQAELIDMIPKAKFDRKTGLYSVPNRAYPVLQLHKFIKETKIFYTEGAKEAILALLYEMRRRYKASKALDADIDMEGFGLALDPYQKAGIKAILECQRGFIADGMGLGKTRQGLGVLFKANQFPALVICPASVPINWMREGQEGLRGRAFYQVDKTRLPKHTCTQKQLSLLDMAHYDASCKMCRFNQADVVIVNYDKLAIGWKNAFEIDKVSGRKKKIKGYKREKGERADVELSEVGSALAARRFRSVIIDESHYIKEETAQRTKAVHEIAIASTIRIALTGTPVKNRPKELLPQLKFLDRLDDLGGHDIFCRKFCDADWRGGKFDDKGSSNENELHQMLRSIGFVQRNKRDVRSDLPPVREATIWVDLDNWEEYHRVEEDVVNWCAEQAVMKEEFLKMIACCDPMTAAGLIEKKMIETRIKIMRVQALVKIGALKKVAALGKLANVQQWIQDFRASEKRLVIFAHFRDVQYAIGDTLNCLHLYGKDNVVNRQKHIDIFMGNRANDTGLVDQEIICSYGAVKEGVNLDNADDILLFDQQWTPTDEDQAIARIDRHRVHNITAWRARAAGTIEDNIAIKLADKRRITDAITKGIRGPAGAQEMDIVGELISDLAAQSTVKFSGGDAFERAKLALQAVVLDEQEEDSEEFFEAVV